MRFGDDREPLEMTKFSTRMMIRVCPNCNAGNQVSLTWHAGWCRACKKLFTADNALPESEMAGELHKSPVKPIDKAFTSIKGEAEERAYAWKDEQEQLAKTGRRKHGIASGVRPRHRGRPVKK